MTGKRNFANIGCNTGVAEQNMQHFMSNSQWTAQGVIQQVQAEIATTPGLGQGGVLILDERAEMNDANYDYMAEVPQNTQVYLKRPVVGVPEAKPGRRGPKPSRSRVLSADTSLKVSDVARLEETNWKHRSIWRGHTIWR